MDGEREMDDDSPDVMAAGAHDAHEPGQDPPTICADAMADIRARGTMAVATGLMADIVAGEQKEADAAEAGSNSTGDGAALDNIVLFDHPMLQDCAVEVSKAVYGAWENKNNSKELLGLERPDPAPRSRRRWGDEGISIR